MDAAVSVALDAAVPGDVVLLSPACSSFDLYNNYKERGDHFRALVHKLAAEKEKTNNHISCPWIASSRDKRKLDAHE